MRPCPCALLIVASLGTGNALEGLNAPPGNWGKQSRGRGIMSGSLTSTGLQQREGLAVEFSRSSIHWSLRLQASHSTISVPNWKLCCVSISIVLGRGPKTMKPPLPPPHAGEREWFNNHCLMSRASGIIDECGIGHALHDMIRCDIRVAHHISTQGGDMTKPC